MSHTGCILSRLLLSYGLGSRKSAPVIRGSVTSGGGGLGEAQAAGLQKQRSCWQRRRRHELPRAPSWQRLSMNGGLHILQPITSTRSR